MLGTVPDIMPLLSVVAFLLFVCPFGQQGSSPATPTTPVEMPAAKQEEKAAAPVAPTFGPSHVELEDSGISFDLPEGIRSRLDLQARMNANFKKKSASGKPCVESQLNAFDTLSLRNILVYRYNGECFENGLTPDRVRSTTNVLLKSMLHPHGMETMASPMDYTLGTRSASLTTGNVYSKQNHGVLFGEAMCVPSQMDLTCFLFFSSTASKVRRLAALPLRFGNDAPTAAIPEDVSRFNLLPTITFHDDKRHIEYSYPGSFAKAQSRMETILSESNGDEDKTRQALRCVHPLLSAEDWEDDSHSNLLIFTNDLKCNNLSPDTHVLHVLTEGLSKGYKKRGGKLKKPVPYKLGERDAVLVQGTMRKGEFRDHEARISTACTLVATDMVCWQFFSNSVDMLHTLEQSAVSFDRGLGRPLVPKDLLTEEK